LDHRSPGSAFPDAAAGDEAENYRLAPDGYEVARTGSASLDIPRQALIEIGGKPPRALNEIAPGTVMMVSLRVSPVNGVARATIVRSRVVLSWKMFSLLRPNSAEELKTRQAAELRFWI
jgi:hypothetical protein